MALKADSAEEVQAIVGGKRDEATAGRHGYETHIAPGLANMNVSGEWLGACLHERRSVNCKE
jgi:hypothetical protein